MRTAMGRFNVAVEVEPCSVAIICCEARSDGRGHTRRCHIHLRGRDYEHVDATWIDSRLLHGYIRSVSAGICWWRCSVSVLVVHQGPLLP